MTTALNFDGAWIAFVLGCIAGAVPGLYFYSSDWLGGYASWPRRMIRLAHISFFGLGGMNLGFALTARTLGITEHLEVPSLLLLASLVSMPLVCWLSAWRPQGRHLFFLPAGAALIGCAWFAWLVMYVQGA